MKKLFWLTLLALPSTAAAMYRPQIRSINTKLPTKPFAYSTQNSFKPLLALSLPEVGKLADNKKFAQQYLQLALLRDEDCECNTPISPPSYDIRNLWKTVFNQFSIQDWNSMLLEREEHSILAAIDSNLLNFIKTINFKELASTEPDSHNDSLIARIARAYKSTIIYNHGFSKKSYDAKPVEEAMQHNYQTKLQAAGYPRLPGLIYQWNNNPYGYGPACSIGSHIYITPDSFNIFTPEERLAILAQNDQHQENFHTLKQICILLYLKKQDLPALYLQFMQKEADLKAAAYSKTIAAGLLNYLIRMKEQSEILSYINYQKTYPSYKERIDSLKNLIDKLDKEKEGYVWNPFHKNFGPDEWFMGQETWHNSKLEVKAGDFSLYKYNERSKGSILSDNERILYTGSIPSDYV